MPQRFSQVDVRTMQQKCLYSPHEGHPQLSNGALGDMGKRRTRFLLVTEVDVGRHSASAIDDRIGNVNMICLIQLSCSIRAYAWFTIGTTCIIQFT